MAEILVVDDSQVDRTLAGRLLEGGDFHVAFATNGLEALHQMADQPPDLVLSDLQMPEMNGLELVSEIREQYPSIPVILITARGSEEIAMQALRIGAAGYVPKSSLAKHLLKTVEKVLSASVADRLHPRLMHSMEFNESRFRLQNDPDLFDPLVEHVQELLRCMRLVDEAERVRTAMAIRYALSIAHFHGNLGIKIAPSTSDADFEWMSQERRREAPWADRVMNFQARVNREKLTVAIEHDGPPIDISQLPDNMDNAAIDRDWLAGFIVLQSVMDKVCYGNDTSRMTMTKHACDDDDNDMELNGD